MSTCLFGDKNYLVFSITKELFIKIFFQVMLFHALFNSHDQSLVIV